MGILAALALLLAILAIGSAISDWVRLRSVDDPEIRRWRIDALARVLSGLLMAAVVTIHERISDILAVPILILDHLSWPRGGKR